MRFTVMAFSLGFLAACGGGNEEPAQSEDVAPAEETTVAKPSEPNHAFFPVAQIDEEGALLITLPSTNEDGVSLRAIHSSGVTSGLGSNPVGLDRGFQDSGRIIAFRRVGKKVLVEEENWRYRASADNQLEKKAVLDSFARSLLWAGEVKDENSDGSYTVDLSGFLTSDTLDLRGWLSNAGQGTFSFASDRTFVDPSSVLVFPDNVEVDATVTLTSDKPGSQVAATAANGRSVTLTIHHSFVRLPEDGYTPRLDDPRVGAIDIGFYDFSTPLDEPIVQRYARRFRLERQDPEAASGPVKKPIVFYVDSGAPQQIRDALIEGASWWAEAFEEAGFEDAFRVEVLPEDVHPFDVRYNVIQWTHRQTRGWSYGGGVADPRTGEMLKGHVILGSQRVRQDRMIFEGLAGAAKSGTGEPDDPVELALARIRQLSAHEVGHPLGFEHNFAASSINRASVMDYPAPLVRPTADGQLDLSDVYDVGIGEWDKFTVKWLYSQFTPDIDERAALNGIVKEGYESGLRFVADGEGRSVGTAQPDGSVWDNGADAIATLNETMRVREIALSQFGLDAIQDGQPRSNLRAVIVPIYLYHRYQTAAASKFIGGYQFGFSIKDDGVASGRPVSRARQEEAVAAILATLDPAVLDLPDRLLDLLTPADNAYSNIGRAETFSNDTGPMFDLLSAADAAGSISLTSLLHPQRLARLVETERRNATALTMAELLSGIEAQLFQSRAGRQGDIQRVLQSRYVSMLIELAGGVEAGSETRAAARVSFPGGVVPSPIVQSRIDGYLKTLANRIAPGLLAGAGPDRSHREWLIARIERHHNRTAIPVAAITPAPVIPPGSPIGGKETCWHCDSEF